MNTTRTKEFKRYSEQRHPANRDLPSPGAFAGGVEDPEILSLLGKLVGTWSHLEEAMIYVFATLSGMKRRGPSREIFRSIIAQEVKIRMMRFLLEESEINAEQPPFFDVVLDKFQSLNSTRNKYIHGLWFNGQGVTYLSSTDPARHPFETVTRKIVAKELQDFLKRTSELTGAITEYQLYCDPEMRTGTEWPAPMRERHERLRQGKF
jgi:hypothetical protein